MIMMARAVVEVAVVVMELSVVISLMALLEVVMTVGDRDDGGSRRRWMTDGLDGRSG